MFADIAHGHTDAADIFFLIGVILFVVAGFFEWRKGTLDGGGPGVIVALGLASVSLGWLLL